jgi:E3 ubiquitin-protein ligase SIAH1
MAPGSSIVTVVPESDCVDHGLSEALSSIRLDGESTSKPSWAASLVNVGLSSLTGLNDLLECPVCTNSMRPPILQVCMLMCVITLFSPSAEQNLWAMCIMLGLV